MSVDQAEFHTQAARLVYNAAAKLDLGKHWNVAAVDAIVQLPAIRAWIDCEATVEALRDRHVPKPVAAGSTWSECAGCRVGPFPCPDALALGWKQ